MINVPLQPGEAVLVFHDGERIRAVAAEVPSQPSAIEITSEPERPSFDSLTPAERVERWYHFLSEPKPRHTLTAKMGYYAVAQSESSDVGNAADVVALALRTLREIPR